MVAIGLGLYKVAVEIQRCVNGRSNTDQYWHANWKHAQSHAQVSIAAMEDYRKF